jgi:predicted nucleotidyltransferase
VKTELDHLPLRKREQLAAITALLRENAPVDMIVLFGSYALSLQPQPEP